MVYMNVITIERVKHYDITILRILVFRIFSIKPFQSLIGMGDVASYGIGASLLGSFSDRFGRKKMILLAIGMLCIFHPLSSLASNYITYTSLQWCAGNLT